eukprot:TRINITY_DN9179_c0_g1_i1.p1 TRINITY_DN9179_c0_g1~~TRINITY_DN9179_c0_g1_i1.p1  ORF type:complete len:530 (+),score=121.43 TRINITY_DN9179_c0_g1_i1:142-1731(+)
MKRLLNRRVVAALAVGVPTAFLAYDYNFNEEAFSRNLRSLKTAVGILVDYKLFYDPENLDVIHEKAAHRILDCCQRNGGLYIKMGQGIAAMNHVLPPQYNKTFSVLYDKAPSVDYNRVEKIFYEDLGKPPDEIFSFFDHQPVASASIAQVHRATLKTGEKVAVKVQKPQIRVQMDWDLFMYKTLTRMMEFAFDLPFYWSVPYTEQNLRKEVDFRIEAANTKRAAANWHTEKLYVPKIFDQFTTGRILVTEWIDGVRINDEPALKAMNITPKEIVTTLTEAMGEQIFVSGFVHADPHVGNLLVRKFRDHFQLVVLDHGMYIEESEQFRKTYCDFWRSMVLLDTEKISEITKSWGIRDAQLFASVNMMKPYNPGKASYLKKNTSKAELARMQMEAKERVKDMLENTALIPREFIFVGRCMNLIRSNNKLLGSPVNRVVVLAKCADKGSRASVAPASAVRDLSWKHRVENSLEGFVFDTRLAVISLLFNLAQFWQNVNAFFGRRVIGFEEALELGAKKTIEQQFGIEMQLDE